MDEKRTPGGQSVTAAVYADRARSWAIALEEDEAATRGLDRVEDARAYVARRTGVPAGTLRSLRKKRLKTVAAHVYDLLHQAAVDRLERRLKSLEHELHYTRQQGLDARPHDAAAVVADIASVRAALGLKPLAAPSEGGAS